MGDINIITDPNSRMVSGPINVMRLEGEVQGIKKVIYLFMDFHISINNQTQCQNIFSQDVQKYFANNFYKLNNGSIVYDFFVELYPSELAHNSHQKGITHRDYKDIYIEEVVKLFKKIFRYDPRKNIVRMNKLFKNIRLHYLDIREYFKYNIPQQISEMTDIAKDFMQTDNIDIKELVSIINLMQVMRDHLQYIINVLVQRSDKNIPTPKIIKRENRSTPDTQSIEYLANKIKNLYKHSDVKKAMRELINLSISNFKIAISEIDDATKRFNSYADAISNSNDKLVRDENTSYMYTYGLSPYTIRQMIVDIINTTDKLMDERFIEFFARFTDIYFLRRFLDKDYVTNAIVYTGALHSNTYIYFLINFFDFRITHASYSKITNMNKLTNEVKKRSIMEIQELILPTSFEQCSNMDSFPKEFL
jgi:hypothetical protein